jgi:hypothetical protein
MTDLTQVEKATGERLEATAYFGNYDAQYGTMVADPHQDGVTKEWMNAARAMRDELLALIMRLVGELKSVRTFLEVDDDTTTCTVVMLAANMLHRMERAERGRDDENREGKAAAPPQSDDEMSAELSALRCVYRELTGKDWNWTRLVCDE